MILHTNLGLTDIHFYSPPWKKDTVNLYSDMPKHQATALFLLRTEVIGLNGWLASINVPGIDARCGCGWQTQTVHHVLMLCPLYSNGRAELVRRTDSEEMWRMLSTPEKAQAIAQWFVSARDPPAIRLSKGN